MFNRYIKTLFFTVCLSLLSAFGQASNSIFYSIHNNSLISTWLKYDTPINGYEILLHCIQEKPQSSYFDTEIYLTKAGKTDTIRQTISFDNWEPWQLQGYTEKDTVIIQNTHVSQHIDWTNIVYFEDMDFDGEKELVVCGHPRPNRSLEEDYIDCEEYNVYRKSEFGFCQIHNIVFDELSEGMCRTGFLFDTTQKTITLTGFLGAGGFKKETFYFKNGEPFKENITLPYRLFRSEKAKTTTEAVPLVVFLHGAGERGNDNNAQLRHCVNYFLEDTITNRYPFLLLVPQCPDGKRWVNTDWSLPEHQMESEPTAELLCVMHLVDSLVDCGAADAQHVYISGISMGGFGVWDALQRWPDRFAAGIAICGGGDPAYAYKMKDTPVYIFHGMQDDVVMPQRSIQMYDALIDAGNDKAILVVYPDLDHGCWDEAFSTPGLFKWLFDN